MSNQMLNYHLQRLEYYRNRLMSAADPAMHQKYANKVQKHWLKGYQQWQQLGQPFLQFNPFTQINPHFQFNPNTEVNPKLNTQVQVNPKAYFNFDPDFEINIGNKYRKRR